MDSKHRTSNRKKPASTRRNRSERAPAAAPAPNLVRATEPPLHEPGGETPLEINRRITQGYIQLANTMQALLDPSFRSGGVSKLRPNWFAIAPHASQEAGKGMLGARFARLILDAAEGDSAPSVQHALARGGLAGRPREVAERVANTLRWYGLPHDVAAALGALLSAANLEVLADPRTLWITTYRFARLVQEAPGPTPLDKVESVVCTLEKLLLDGNEAIFGDIARSARVYLDWRQQVGAQGVTAARVVEQLALPGARPEEAARAWRFGLEHARDERLPTDFAQALPGVSGQSLVVAAFALYEDARQASSLELREALIASANNYLAWREQHDVVQPAFTLPQPPAGEVSRSELMRAMTPLLRLELGRVAWEFSDYTATQRDKDYNPLTSKPTEYNWALFADRWPAILHTFALGYRHPEALWEMPKPLLEEARAVA
jgi:hypothetical protein